jgi:SAM-dependent methyltransferase
MRLDGAATFAMAEEGAMMVSTDWWKKFFSGLTLDLWRACVQPDWTRAECDAIQKLLGAKPGHRLLDVPCGFGRHALELAGRGFDVVGVDFTPDFVAEASANTAMRRLAARFERRDMRDLPWTATFDGAYCFGNSFGYMDDDANEAFIGSVARTLKLGARFALATTCLESLLPGLQPREWFTGGEITMLEENRYDWERTRFETDYTFIQGSRTEKRSGTQKLYTYRDLVDLLGRHGLKVEGSYGSAALEPFKLGSRELLLAASKIC